MTPPLESQQSNNEMPSITQTLTSDDVQYLSRAVWREYERQRGAQLFMVHELGYHPMQVTGARVEADELERLYARLREMWDEMYPPGEATPMTGEQQ